MRVVTLAGLIALSIGSMARAAEPNDPSILGNWARGDGKVRVKIERCGDDPCATNTWVRSGITDELVGDTLVMSVKPVKEDKLQGTAFEGRRKLSMTMSIDIQPNSLTTNGCILGGIICNKMGWTRLSASN